jgi:predicted short-subunit dehydrogenase-like oxidoreductase (DUF2520 family)
MAWWRAGPQVRGFSHSSASRERARAEGVPIAAGLKQALSSARCIVVCVGEDRLEKAAEEIAHALAPKTTPICLHTCGSRGASALWPLAARGCPVGTFHPLAAFSPQGPGPTLTGAWCAVGGDDEARAAGTELAGTLGAHAFALKDSPEAALRYHTAATLLANGSVALASLAIELAEKAFSDPEAVRSAFIALLRSTLANLEQAPPERALTGPVARGELHTVRAHLAGLADEPATLAVYRELSKRMRELAVRDTRLGDEAARELERLLAQ